MPKPTREELERSAYVSWRSVIEPQPELNLGNLLRFNTINRYSLMALGPDVSHWTPKDYNIEGSDFIIIKMGGSETSHPYDNPYTDSNFNYWVDKAWNTPNRNGGVGIPVIVYWMQNPRVYFENGISKEQLYSFSEQDHIVFKEIIKAWHSGKAWKNILEFFFDFEEASLWGGGSDLWQWIYTDELKNRITHKVNANEQPYPFPPVKIGMYSRLSFIKQHPAIMNWLRVNTDVSTWPANYPRRIPNSNPNITADEVRELYLPLDHWVPYPLLDMTLPDNKAREKSWDYWQFSGEPDWNVFNGTPQELYSRLGFVARENNNIPPEPDPIPEDPTSAKVISKVNIRTKPSTLNNIPYGTLPVGTEIEITDTIRNDEGTWRKALLEVYIADEVKGKKYLDTP